MDSIFDRAKEILRPVAAAPAFEFEAARRGRLRQIFLAQNNAERALHLSPTVVSEVDLLMQAEAARQAGQKAVAEATQPTLELEKPEVFDPRYVAGISGENDLASRARQTLNTIEFPIPNVGGADEKLAA